MAIKEPVLMGQGTLSLGDVDRRKARGGLSFPPYTESLVKPEFQKDCNINILVARYKKTGLLTHVQAVQGQYGDFIDMPSYHEAMNQVASANSMFNSLPADLRALFNNDPATFLDFAQNPANQEQMKTLGLIPSQVNAQAQPQMAKPADVVKADSSADSSKL